MGDRGDGGVVEGKRQACNLLDTQSESLDQGVLGHVKDARIESLSVVVDLGDGHTVSEWRDVEHVQQCSLGRSDSSTTSNDLDVRNNLNGTSGNLGWDTESLEEGGLSGLHTGVAGLDNDVGGGVGTGTGGSGNSVRQDQVTDVLEVTGCENETNVSLDERSQLLELRLLRDDQSESTSDHRVLSHENGTGTSERVSNLVHLLRSDVVNVDNEDRGVGVKGLIEPDEPCLLCCSGSSHFGLDGCVL